MGLTLSIIIIPAILVIFFCIIASIPPKQGHQGNSSPNEIFFHLKNVDDVDDDDEDYGEYEFDIVGESFHQDSLRKIVDEDVDEDWQEHYCTALLVEDNQNEHDKNAIIVIIDNHHVGYLSRQDAAQYREFLNKNKLVGKIAEVDAVIVGSSKRKGRKSNYGVKLDLIWPPQLKAS